MMRRVVQDVESGQPAIRQRGYAYQKGRKKGEPWKPKELGYGRYRVDVPGEPGQQEARVALSVPCFISLTVSTMASSSFPSARRSLALKPSFSR